MDNNQPRNLPEPKNEIVVYQPDETTRLSVCFDGETVWLSQEQMIVLFQRDRSVISRHIANAFKEGEVDKENCLHILQTLRPSTPSTRSLPSGTMSLSMTGFSSSTTRMSISSAHLSRISAESVSHS